MIQSAIVLLRQLEEELPALSDAGNIIEYSAAAIHSIEDYLHQVRSLSLAIREHKADEIYFYKVITPTLYSYLIYYVRLYQIEAILPPARSAKEKIYKKELKLIGEFFSDNETAYRYFKTGDESFDPELFRYQKHLPKIHIEESAYFVDHTICTPMGLRFARFMAYERLVDYITAHTGTIGASQGDVYKLPDDLSFIWSDKKINLEQLCYALAYSGSVNNGNAPVKAIAKVLGLVFRTDLSNIHRSKQNMYTRKNEAAFLEFLLKCFKQGLSDSDDRYNTTSGKK